LLRVLTQTIPKARTSVIAIMPVAVIYQLRLLRTKSA
jgi:hypothetical protein